VAGLTGAFTAPVIGPAEQVLGSVGPILFFVISGFLLYRPYTAARAAGRPFPSVAHYARRRVLRIVPAYWVALTVLALFPGIVGVFTGDWWRYYFFLQAYAARTFGGGIPVGWTLCVEVAFYLTLPLWALLVQRLARDRDAPAGRRIELGALALLAAGGIAVQLAAARHAVSALLADSLAGQCTWLALGMAIAVASVAAVQSRDDVRPVRFIAEHAGLCWLGAGAAFAGLAAAVPPENIFGLAARVAARQPIATTLRTIALTAVLCALLVAPAVFGERGGGLPRRLLAWGPIAWIGLISYGMYLWHLAIAEWIGLPSDPTHFSASGLGLISSVHHARTLLLLVCTFAATAAVAAVSYYVVELPFLRRKER
jgi:peptidoglycan/LPS O-acetylase OafA/YrhL